VVNHQHIDTNVGVSFSPSPRPPILSPCPRLLDTVAYPAHFFAIAMCFQTRVCPHPDPSLSPFISPLSPFPTHQVSMLLLSVRWSGSVPPNSLRHFFPAVFFARLNFGAFSASEPGRCPSILFFAISSILHVFLCDVIGSKFLHPLTAPVSLLHPLPLYYRCVRRPPPRAVHP
jgi:hypothetical protein